MKPRLIDEYLRTVPAEEWICVVDGYDVILLRPLDDLPGLLSERCGDENRILGFARIYPVKKKKERNDGVDA